MLRDLCDYLNLRAWTPDAWKLVRCRRRHREGQTLQVGVCSGHQHAVVDLRGGTQDVSVFFEIFARDAYRLSGLPSRLGTVIDLGANVGLFSFRAAGIAQRVLGFEPMPENFAQFRRNTSSLENVESHNLAVGAGQGTLTLFSAATSRGTGRFSSQPQERVHDASRRIEVECISLDALFARHRVDRCDLLKIDIEGSEYDVLLNASGPTLAQIGRIHGEFHPSNDRTDAQAQLRVRLEEAGFTTEWKPQKDDPRYGMFFARRA